LELFHARSPEDIRFILSQDIITSGEITQEFKDIRNDNIDFTSLEAEYVILLGISSFRWTLYGIFLIEDES
jgi:hypothetical protein